MATQADLDAIESAIARGERIVRMEDRMVEYRSVDEMVRAAGYIRQSLSSAGGVTRSTRLYFERD